jgi:protein tyrosine/serine phosphatase
MPDHREPDGIHNFRELSGYVTSSGACMRPGMIFRSGALELMSEEDYAWLRDEIRVHTILDLRHADELAMRKGPHQLDAHVVSHSIFPETVKQDELIAELNGLYGPGISPGRYLHYLEIGGDRLAEAFRLFADESNYPFLVHCTAGKDRTGVLLGMLMDVLGCEDEDIAHEYGLSEAAIDRLIAYLRSSGRQLEGTEEDLRARLATPPDRMAGFIKLLREKYGSSEAFFKSKGISKEEIARVRELLTAPD